MVVFLLDLSGNVLLNEIEQVIKVLLIVDKSVNGQFVVIFGAEKFLKSWFFLLEVQVVKQASHTVENCDIADSKNKFLFDLSDCFDDISQVGQDLFILFVLCGSFRQVRKVENGLSQVFVDIFFQKVMNDFIELFLQKAQVIQSSDDFLELLFNFGSFLLCYFHDCLAPFWFVMNLGFFTVVLSQTVIKEIYVFADLVFENGV